MAEGGEGCEPQIVRGAVTTICGRARGCPYQDQRSTGLLAHVMMGSLLTPAGAVSKQGSEDRRPVVVGVPASLRGVRGNLQTAPSNNKAQLAALLLAAPRRRPCS